MLTIKDYVVIVMMILEKNYRFNKHCEDCGKFKGKNHNCHKRKIGNDKYWCRGCKEYLPKVAFQKDCTKRFGINTLCKLCRMRKGNGN